MRSKVTFKPLKLLFHILLLRTFILKVWILRLLYYVVVTWVHIFICIYTTQITTDDYLDSTAIFTFHRLLMSALVVNLWNTTFSSIIETYARERSTGLLSFSKLQRGLRSCFLIGIFWFLLISFEIIWFWAWFRITTDGGRSNDFNWFLLISFDFIWSKRGGLLSLHNTQHTSSYGRHR